MRRFIHDGHVNLLGSLICGAMAGVAFWLPVYPIDYVKTIVQGDSLTNPKYNGNLHCARMEYQRAGPKVFFTALDIMLGRALVSGAFGFLCFEIGKKMVY